MVMCELDVYVFRVFIFKVGEIRMKNLISKKHKKKMANCSCKLTKVPDLYPKHKFVIM